MQFIRKHRVTIVGVLAGALGGYLYYQYVGCMSGTCPITSKPLNSTLYGTVMGALLFSNFEQKKIKSENQNKYKSEQQ